jgi:hypothetical protein
VRELFSALEYRVASLVGAIERRTGADVVGLADSRSQLRGWRFDRVVGDLRRYRSSWS